MFIINYFHHKYDLLPPLLYLPTLYDLRNRTQWVLRIYLLACKSVGLSSSAETTGLFSWSVVHFQFYHLQRTVFTLFVYFFYDPNLLLEILTNKHISERAIDEGHPYLFLLFPVKRLLFFSMTHVNPWRLIKV